MKDDSLWHDRLRADGAGVCQRDGALVPSDPGERASGAHRHLQRSLRPEKIGWFTGNFPSIDLVTEDYRELLASPEVDAVYVAVPHHLHQEIYCAAIRAGKHLLGEKPMGIDLAANEAILDCMGRHPTCWCAAPHNTFFTRPSSAS